MNPTSAMFHVSRPRIGRGFQLAIVGLIVLSLAALSVTIWILADFQREQQIVADISRHLPASDRPAVSELAGELRLQSRLTLLLILNGIVTSAAIAMLVRAYVTSEQSLRNVKGLATDILASMDQGILTTDRDGLVMSVNPRGLALLEQTSDIIGHPLQSATGHEKLQEICTRVLEQHDSVRDVDYTVVSDGHHRTLRASCTQLRNDHSQIQGTVIQVRDVTERELTEQRLRRMERYMALGSLAAGLQHEIKNPLSALSLHVQLLQEELNAQRSTPEIDEMLGVLRTEITRITSVLEGFRNYASLAKLGTSAVDLGQLVTKLARLIEPQAQQQGVTIVMDVPDDTRPLVQADSIRLEQLMLNLAVNALAAMPNGGTLTLRLHSSADAVQLDVADTGCGIPEDLRDRIFDPYFTTRHEGTGMGLALSEKIVRQHNGSIDFTSGPAGTTFSVTLPHEFPNDT